jgi:hypothetical protein
MKKKIASECYLSNPTKFADHILLLKTLINFFLVKGLLQCAFSFDILIGVANIPKLNFLKSKKSQFIIIALAVLFNVILYFPVLISSGFIRIPYGNNITIQLCDITSFPYWKVYNLITFVETLLQFLIMTLISLAILRLLAKSRQTMEASMGRELHQRRSRDVKFSVTCLTLNLVFGLFRLPLLIVYYMYYSGAGADINGLYVTAVFFYMDFSIGFLVFIVSNKMFRNECLVFFRLRQGESLSSTGGKTANTNRIHHLALKQSQVPTIQA